TGAIPARFVVFEKLASTNCSTDMSNSNYTLYLSDPGATVSARAPAYVEVSAGVATLASGNTFCWQWHRYESYGASDYWFQRSLTGSSSGSHGWTVYVLDQTPVLTVQTVTVTGTPTVSVA